MAQGKKIEATPSAYDITGLKLDALVDKKFLDELKKDIPGAFVAGLVFGFDEGKNVVILSHDREEGKYSLESVGIRGAQPATDKILRILERVENQ